MTSLIKMFSGRKRGSDVWRHFTCDEQKCKSYCLIQASNGAICNMTIATKNPTNLKNHLKSHHTAEYQSLLLHEAEESEAKKQRVNEG
jgi:hypothetical protein